MRTPRPMAAVLLVLLAAPALLPAQQAMPVIRETKPGLKAQATLSADSAVAIALRTGPKGSKIKAAELEEEKGLLIYSFDLTVPGKPGIQEIGIDARPARWSRTPMKAKPTKPPRRSRMPSRPRHVVRAARCGC